MRTSKWSLGVLFVALGGIAVTTACGSAPPADDGNGTGGENGLVSSSGSGHATSTVSSTAASTSAASTSAASTGTGGKTCPHTGPDVANPSGFPPCPSCGDGHCVPNAIIPPAQLSNLAMCDASSSCVPDVLIKSGGDFIPPTCKSIAGFEGRCLSKCLPQVAGEAAQVPQDICTADEACVPCYNPQDGTPTGACTTSCDPGPMGGPMMLPSCCNGIGQCVPAASVPPDKAGELGPDSCPMDASNFLCAPTALVTGMPANAGDLTNTKCDTSFIVQLLFGPDYKEGRCLPTCIPKVDKAPLIGDGSCNDNNYKCVPCLDPQTGQPSGVCM